MIKRLVWVGIGVTIGVLAVRKASQAKENFGPGGLNRAVGSINDKVSNFADAVRGGMAERETDLRAALGLDGLDPQNFNRKG